MSSIEESKRQVKASLESLKDTVDHDAVLESLQDEIDKHNETRGASREEAGKRRLASSNGKGGAEEHLSSMKFRFKSSTSDPRKRKHSSRHRSHHHGRKHRRDGSEPDTRPTAEAAHPFPREPIEVDREGHLDTKTAFRESLFDALADDEGAAYWESVYSQPIHVYPRPSVQTPQGELEQMDDEHYAAYVQAKMWEKKNPHIVRERERRDKQQRQEEEERVRRREEFVRRKQRAAWEKAEREGAKAFSDDDQYEFAFEFDTDKGVGSSSTRSQHSQQRDSYRQAWEHYLGAWDRLKHELLKEHETPSHDNQGGATPSERLPWPVLPSKPVTKSNIEDFMRWIGESHKEKSKLQLLKLERVRWHPDKMQQRFMGNVDENTLKLVTSVFQVIDELTEIERRHGGSKAV